jgi:mercuric ion binding protein
MKKLSLILALCSFFAFALTANTIVENSIETTIDIQKLKTVTFKVYGNCSMCKTTIEKSLKGVKGIAAATWNVDKKMITVTYNPKKVELLDIHNKIAAVGYDTDIVKAKDNVYDNLHGCCQYERPKS